MSAQLATLVSNQIFKRRTGDRASQNELIGEHADRYAAEMVAAFQTDDEVANGISEDIASLDIETLTAICRAAMRGDDRAVSDIILDAVDAAIMRKADLQANEYVLNLTPEDFLPGLI